MNPIPVPKRRPPGAKSAIRPPDRRSVAALIQALAPGILGVTAVAAYGASTGMRYGHMTRDPLVVLHAAVTVGVLSVTGGLFWAASTAVCWFAAWVLRGRGRSAARFLFWSGAFTAFLMLDDVYLLHDRLLPAAGVPERLVQVSYLVICAAWLLRFRRIILAAEWLTLGAALTFFAASQAIDISHAHASELGFLLEDGAKFIGIVAWLAYFTHFAAAELRSRAD